MLLKPESTQPENACVKRRMSRRRAVATVLAACFLVLAGVTGWAAWALFYSELPLGFLRGRIEASARAKMPDAAAVHIGSITASYASEDGLSVHLADLSISLPSTADITVDSVSAVADSAALLDRSIVFHSVRIAGVDVAVRGESAMGATLATTESVKLAARQLAAGLIAADDHLRAANLATLDATDISVSWDGAADRRIAIADATWMPLGGGRSKAWLQMAMESGGGWDLTVEREEGRLGGAVSLIAEDLPITTIAPLLGDPSRRPNFNGILSGHTRITLGRDGRFIGLRGVISSGPGGFSVGESDTVNIASASIGFGMGAGDDRIRIPAGEIRTVTGAIAFQGWLGRPTPEEPVMLVTRLMGGALPTGRPEHPLTVLRTGGMVARIDVAKAEVSVERLDVTTDSGSASAVGQVSFGGVAPGLSLALSVSAMPAADMRALWPPFIASKTRRWFDENVYSGTVGPATLQVSLPAEFMGPEGRGRALPTYALNGSLPFHGATFSPFRTFPKIGSADGEIAFGGGAATVTALSGIIDVPQMGSIDAAGTTLVIGELGRSQPYGDLHLELTGPAAGLARVSDTPPLRVASTRGIVPEDLSGTAELSLDAEIPLFDREDMSDVIPTFRLALADFSSKSAIDGRRIEDADIVLEGRTDSYTVKGRGRLDGIEASVDLIAGSAAEGATDVKLTLDDAARERLGLGLEDFVSGPVTATVRQIGAEQRSIELDLRQARIMLAFAGWEKGAGVPAKASFRMEEGADGVTTISDLVLSGEGFGARGRVVIGADKRIADIDLPEVGLRPGDRMSARLTRKGNAFDLRIDGSRMDARGLIEAAKAGMNKEKDDDVPVHVAVKIASVTGQNGVVAEEVSGVLETDGNGVQTAGIRGKINNQDFEWALDRKGDRRSLLVTSGAGGALIRMLGIYDKVAGGTLVLEYSGSAEAERGGGSLVLKDFRVLEEPALAPAVQTANNAASRGGAPATANPGDLAFERLVIPFSRSEGVISISEAFLRGPVIGATGSGTLNLTAGKIAVSGTFIPIFGLNNIAGSIPILGTILGGGRNEGLLGITYKLFGPIEDPSLTMNPLSAIAPGIFRKLFEYR